MDRKPDDILIATNIWKQKADELLSKTGFIADLSRYGTVHFTGAYKYNLMLHGDIDISVVREKPYAVEEVFEIFRALYFKGTFRSYFIGGDWDDPRKGAKFPEGYYIGLKEKINGERWKVDVWFVSEKEFKKRSANDTRMANLSAEQRSLILSCKEYRNRNKLPMVSQEIYDAVIEGRLKDQEDFIRIYENKER